MATDPKHLAKGKVGRAFVTMAMKGDFTGCATLAQAVNKNVMNAAETLPTKIRERKYADGYYEEMRAARIKYALKPDQKAGKASKASKAKK